MSEWGSLERKSVCQELASLGSSLVSTTNLLWDSGRMSYILRFKLFKCNVRHDSFFPYCSDNLCWEANDDLISKCGTGPRLSSVTLHLRCWVITDKQLQTYLHLSHKWTGEHWGCGHSLISSLHVGLIEIVFCHSSHSSSHSSYPIAKVSKLWKVQTTS